MKEEYRYLIVFLIIVGIVTTITIPFMMMMAERDKTIKAEGEVVDLKRESSGHFLGGHDYFVQLNTSIKWYEISENSYWKIEIGDNVIIYESKRVEIIS